jgi:hypothetical protein
MVFFELHHSNSNKPKEEPPAEGFFSPSQEEDTFALDFAIWRLC